MEEVFEKEKGILEMQVEQDKQTIKQLEVRLDISRRTIQDASEARASIEKELFQVQCFYLTLLRLVRVIPVIH